VDHFTQNQIPALKLQDGLQLVKSCIATKMHRPAPERIHRITIYKIVQTSQVIYDYVFVMPRFSPGTCQEILYTPDTGDCEMGMSTVCHITIDN
jgi:hypothetical protein